MERIELKKDVTNIVTSSEVAMLPKMNISQNNNVAMTITDIYRSVFPSVTIGEKIDDMDKLREVLTSYFDSNKGKLSESTISELVAVVSNKLTKAYSTLRNTIPTTVNELHERVMTKYEDLINKDENSAMLSSTVKVENISPIMWTGTYDANKRRDAMETLYDFAGYRYDDNTDFSMLNEQVYHIALERIYKNVLKLKHDISRDDRTILTAYVKEEYATKLNSYGFTESTLDEFINICCSVGVFKSYLNEKVAECNINITKNASMNIRRAVEESKMIEAMSSIVANEIDGLSLDTLTKLRDNVSNLLILRSLMIGYVLYMRTIVYAGIAIIDSKSINGDEANKLPGYSPKKEECDYSFIQKYISMMKHENKLTSKGISTDDLLMDGVKHDVDTYVTTMTSTNNAIKFRYLKDALSYVLQEELIDEDGNIKPVGIHLRRYTEGISTYEGKELTSILTRFVINLEYKGTFTDKLYTSLGDMYTEFIKDNDDISSIDSTMLRRREIGVIAYLITELMLDVLEQ